MSYSINTSALLDGWVRYYPPDVFPGVWGNLSALIDQGNLLATEMVYYELEKKSDEVFEWVSARKSKLFVRVDAEIQALVTNEILKGERKRLLEVKKGRSGADPFVIALAIMRGLTVVTGESRSNNPLKPRIPDVCDALQIKVVRLLDLIREQGWKFTT